MTAAPESLRFPLRPAATTRPVRLLRGWERVLVVLVVCLPVPAIAATGLSIPLPATVERLAASLVPWIDQASFEENESLAVGADGSIVLTSQELEDATVLGETVVRTSAMLTRARVRAEADAANQEAPRKRRRPDRGGSTGHSDSPGGGPGTTSGGGQETTSGGGQGTTSGGGSGSSSDPVQTAVDTAEGATQPVVGTVDDTVQDPVGTVEETVGDVTDSVGDVVPLP